MPWTCNSSALGLVRGLRCDRVGSQACRPECDPQHPSQWNSMLSSDSVYAMKKNRLEFLFIVNDRKNLVKCFFLNYFFYFLRLNTISPLPFLSSNPTTCLPCSILLSLHNATSVHVFRADHWYWITNCYVLPWRRLFLLPEQSLVACSSLCEVEA